jgi:RNA polymerase primary sigma factor
MPKKRQGRKDDRDTSQEMQKVRVEDADGEFERDDEALDDDDNLFDSGVTDTSEFPAEEPEEFDEEFDDEDLSSESIAMDSAALVDDPVRMYLKEIGLVPLLDTNRETWLSTQVAAEQLLDNFMHTL